MTTILGFILIATMAVLVLTSPKAALLLYAGTATFSDGFGVSSYLGTRFVALMAMLYGLLVLISCLRAAGPQINGSPYRVAIRVAAAVSLAVPLITYLKGAHIAECLSALGDLGIPAFVIWAVSPPSKKDRLFTGFVAAQIFLALAVLTLPSVAVFSGDHYASILGLSGDVNTHFNLSIAVDEIGKQAAERYAQFANPNILGFYASIASLVGAMLIDRARRRSGLAPRLLGWAVLAAGLLAWLNSLTRAPFAGAIAGTLLAQATARRAELGGSTKLPNIRWGVVVLSVAALALLSGPLGFLLPSSNDVSVTARVQHYQNALALIRAYPLMGVPNNYPWPNGYPHFLPETLAAFYGLPVAIAFSAVFILGGAHAIVRGMRGGIDREWSWGLALLAALVGIAITNNMAAPILFWTAFAVALGIMGRVRHAEESVAGHVVVGPLAQQPKAARLPRRRTANRVRGEVLRYPAGHQRPG